MPNDAKKNWDEYLTQELRVVTPLLETLGYSLDADQPHVAGERYLMQAVTTTSGKKLILLGRRRSDGMRVVIKTTGQESGMRELQHERMCRNLLPDIGFAYQVFHTPEELFFAKRDGRLISIQAFIEQDSPFTERPVSEQFSLALSAFKEQEGAHATTYEHVRRITKTFGSMGTAGYLNAFDGFIKSILASGERVEGPEGILREAKKILAESKDVIEQYNGFLTHTDFVPHNFRVVGSDIYLLDTASLRFGNKYEGWARFLNFMMLYNPPLTAAFVQYVRDNRSPEESDALKLMRIYRLGEILCYYSSWLDKVSGDLHVLTEARITFWIEALRSLLHDIPLSQETIDTYTAKREALRSEDEKRRQKDLH